MNPASADNDRRLDMAKKKRILRVYFEQVNQCYYDVPIGTTKDVNNERVAEADAIMLWRRDNGWPKIESRQVLKE
jgi:hypothetical protein